MNRLSKSLRLTGLLAFTVPALAAAQAPAGTINTQYLASYKNSIVGIINTILIPLLFAVALLVFMWGVYNYFIAGGANEDKRQEGRQFVLWGVVGFAIIISVWGLVAMVIYTLGIYNGGNALPPPTIGGSGYSSGGTVTPSSGGTVTPAPVNYSNYGGF